MEPQRWRAHRGSAEELNKLTSAIIAAAIEVHRQLGPGLLESVYESCLVRELTLRGLALQRQVHVPLHYRGSKLEEAFRLDLLVARKVIVEVKTTDRRHPIHEAQLQTYLRICNLRLGLILNFNVVLLKHGIQRVVNRFPDFPSDV